MRKNNMIKLCQAMSSMKKITHALPSPVYFQMFWVTMQGPHQSYSQTLY